MKQDAKIAAKPLPVVFFVTLPSEAKGATGAVIGTQTVIDAVAEQAETVVVEMLHRKIRVSGARGKFSGITQLLGDYLQSRKDLRKALDGLAGQPFQFYLCANSSLAGTLRDVATLTMVRRRYRGTRIVLHTRNGDFFFPRGRLLTALRRWELAAAERVICLSRRLLPDPPSLSRVLPEARQDRIRIVPNTIDAAVVATEDELEAKARRTGPITVLYLSNFIPSKGYLKLGETVRRIARAGRLQDFRFVFHGTWPSEDMRQEFRDSFDPEILSSGHVEIGGALWERSQVRQALLDADVFCLPTSYPAEAQPRSILEAMACGCSILANDHASIADMVKPGENGFLTEGITSGDMAEFLLAQDRESLGQQGLASHALFNARFSRAAHEDAIREAILWP
ncbi:glycosyltransferase family 4 protein [Mameliella alba]|nr:glycosyltransferase family 4 protein [Mameliella alba]MBY6168514.1 glycosyltransferase family 4 protein [Mameliella alba]MBY6174265.1 glycosyltransferase family 4 protein [Mameliella alba]